MWSSQPSRGRSCVRTALLVVVLALPWVTATPARGQVPIREAGQQEAARGLGGQVLLTNSGFGLGAFMRRRVQNDRVATFEVSLSSVEDEREVAFFDRFGERDVPNKASYLIEIPFRVGLERRLFRSRIEDNFRPFVHVAGGPVIGWTYPYYDDENGNGVLDTDEPTYDILSGIRKGHLVPGIGAAISVGANFGALSGSTQGIRLGFHVTRFRDEIDLLEPSIKQPKDVFMTPFIMVYFGRLSGGSATR